uniref:Uncharacterized protein n=1 Tax=Anguilla anguilla TaxID=7936 RepID=A0A0E9QN41_ANGAN
MLQLFNFMPSLNTGMYRDLPFPGPLFYAFYVQPWGLFTVDTHDLVPLQDIGHMITVVRTSVLNGWSTVTLFFFFY